MVSSVIKRAVNPLALARLSKDAVTSDVRGLGCGVSLNSSTDKDLPIKLVPSVAMGTTCFGYILDGTCSRRAHYERNTNIAGGSSCSELAIRV